MMNKWLYEIRVKDKIDFSGIRFVRDIYGKGIRIGFTISNMAKFPIDFEISKLSVKLSDRVPSEDHELGGTHTIPAHGNGWHDSNVIQINGISESKAIEGHIDFSVKYGRKGKALKNDFSTKKQIVVVFNENGLLETGSWNDAV